ncbi:hypothetical protein IC582_015628 [Cucumis melo]|uniref:Protein SRG1 isoform X2 n=2 Tax=Cucumis melo TaxID=3656 RepID=A0ABM3L0P5_CUCME|nr:protein SRG1 isoform X2 [Cucumis melo]
MAEEKNNDTLRFGSSILVPSVQELAKHPITEIPHRYIRPDLPHHSPISSDASQIPVIDMSNLRSHDTMDSELSRLHSACKNWGFFQLVKHGVSESLMERMKMETQKLFELPIEEKKKLWQRAGDVEGFGQAFVRSEEQKLDWCDMFFMATLPLHFRNPRLLQNLPLSLRETLEEYSAAVKDVATEIFDGVEKALGIKEGELSELFKNGNQSMRMNYYPPCPEPEKVIGLAPHSDSVGLTILLQINKVEGLKIKKEGNWINVMPLPNAFIVNIGDILEMVTNGEYKSIEHCATVNSKSERLSIATFNSPSLEKEIRPTPSLVTPHSPPLFRTVTHQEYVRGLFSRTIDGKSYLEAMRIHPHST